MVGSVPNAKRALPTLRGRKPTLGSSGESNRVRQLLPLSRVPTGLDRNQRRLRTNPRLRHLLASGSRSEVAGRTRVERDDLQVSARIRVIRSILAARMKTGLAESSLHSRAGTGLNARRCFPRQSIASLEPFFFQARAELNGDHAAQLHLAVKLHRPLGPCAKLACRFLNRCEDNHADEGN